MAKPHIYIVSDSVGETAELVTKAAISQFENQDAELKRFPYVEDTIHIDEVVSLASMNYGMIVYTLVKPEMRKYMNDQAEKHGLAAVDLMGPLMDRLLELYEFKPLYEPGLVRKLDEAYFKKVEAIEFAVKYDDGRDPRGIVRADIVLIGVSRTSKTPLSQYLAHHRYKVANVPIVPEVDPPEELFRIPSKKCIGLKIDPDTLNHIRKERLKTLGLDGSASYATIERIKYELDYFNQIAERLDCKVIDVTNKAVEETANIIMDEMRK
nr:pyruvate, water dikinase regulatory protein [Heyndrickxia coagulans]